MYAHWAKFLLASSFVLCIGVVNSYAQNCDSNQAVAKIVSMQGEVTVNQAQAHPERLVCRGDLIEVGELSRALVKLFSTETTLRIDQSTHFRVLDEPVREQKSFLELLKGVFYLLSREPRELEVRTRFGNASIEGTEFLVQVSSDRTLVTVIEGQILAANNQGELGVGTNQSAIMLLGQAPQLIETIRPEDAVQWALYYRPVLDALYDPANAPEQLREALGTVDYRNVPAILAALNAIPEAVRGESYYVYRAALLMAVGRADQAQNNIARARQLNPANGDASALAAIIAVTQNDKSQALKQAEQAVKQAPESAAAQIALSYAHQAFFQS